MRYALVCLFLLAGCSPSESQLRETAFKNAATSFLANASNAVAVQKRHMTAKGCRSAAFELKELHRQLPEARHNRSLSSAYATMDIVCKNLELASQFIETATEIGKLGDTDVRDEDMKFARGILDNTSDALEDIRRQIH